MIVKCPNCNYVLNLIISLKSELKMEYITRLELAEERSKPHKERKWIVLGYDAKKDRFEVMEGKMYNDT